MRVLILLVTGLLLTHCKREEIGPKYKTDVVRRADLQSKVTATGTMTALVTVQVGSQVSGRIAELYADYNTVVKQGQVIAKLDTALFKAALEQAQANLVVAQGTVAKARAEATGAKRQFERAKTLRANGLVGQSDYDDAETKFLASEAQVKVAEGSVAQARAQYNQARINLQYTTIRSPISGVVISRAVDVGQTVAASLQAPVLFTIAEDLKKMQVDTYVAEADVGALRAGMKASFRVDAYPRETFWGTIRQIRSAPQTNQNVVTYDAVIDVDNPDLKLRPGMTANVTMVTESKSNVLTIANAALRFRPPMPTDAAHGGGSSAPSSTGTTSSSGKVVWLPPRSGAKGTKSSGTPHTQAPRRVTVQVGITDGLRTEIVGGDLKEGDEVITQLRDENDQTGKDSKGSAPRSVRRLM
jgi:HlyD family secretion protein